MAGAIAQDRESCRFPFVLDEKPTVVPVGSAGERLGGARKVLCGGLRGGSGFRLLDCLEQIDSTCWGSRRGAGRQAQMAEELVDHRRIFDGGDHLQVSATVRAV